MKSSRRTLAMPQVVIVRLKGGGVEVTVKGRSEEGVTQWIGFELSALQAQVLASDLANARRGA